MGNQIPETHNQSDSLKKSENTPEIKPIVESIVTDLVNAVHIKESIMSVAPEVEQTIEEEMDLNNTSYFEANDGFTSPFDCDDSPNAANFKTNQTLVPNTINDFMELSRDNIDEENEYSSKRSSSSSPSDWKYSTYSPSNKDHTKPYESYERMSTKYNDILDSWNQNKDDRHIRIRANPSRTSLMRNFDPLFGSENSPNFPSPPERRRAKQSKERFDKMFFDEHNDSTGLISDFAKCKIAETPTIKSEIIITNNEPAIDLQTPLRESIKDPFDTPANNMPLMSPKPDVLAFAVQQQKDTELTDRIHELENELKDKISEFEDYLKQKDIKLDEMNKLLDQTNAEKKEMIQLVETMHDINQELYACSLEKLDSMEREMIEALNAKTELEKRYIESKLFSDKLKDELSSIQLSKNANESQHSLAVERIRQLEEICSQLVAKNDSLEKQIIANDGKKDMENEIMAYKVQNKRLEMKIKSLENQLEQKNKENTELSSMVDELIIKVHK